MTNVTITFVDDKTINIANATAAPVTFAISKLAVAGTFGTAVDLLIANGANANYAFGSDGLYKVHNPTANEGNVIIISNDILSELEEDVKNILLADNIQKVLPKGYDFVSLVLLSLIFIGNNSYQNTLYSAGSLTDYTTIATTFDRCSKYLDRQDNTTQSTNKIWE